MKRLLCKNWRKRWILCGVVPWAVAAFVVVQLVLADELPSPPARIEGEATLTSPVGMKARIQQIVLPGSELIPRAMDSHTSPVVIRIDAVYPHGDGFRYDLTWSGFERGTHDLSKYLARKDGTSTDDLPAIPVAVTSVLASDRLIPNAPAANSDTNVGGYRTLMLMGGILWAVGLFLIIVAVLRQVPTDVAVVDNSPRTRLELIRSLLQDAISGSDFSAGDKAKLEGLVVGFWREHKQIEELSAQAAFSKLQKDSDAGPLLKQLERWLYDRPRPESANLADLLAPLQVMVERAERHAQSEMTSNAPSSTSRQTASAVATTRISQNEGSAS